MNIIILSGKPFPQGIPFYITVKEAAMSKSLKDMIKENTGDKRKEFHAGEEQLNIPAPNTDETKLNASEILAEYGGKSEGELMQRLREVISEQKQNGVFDSAQTEKMAENLMPMLNKEQAEKFSTILKMLE